MFTSRSTIIKLSASTLRKLLHYHRFELSCTRMAVGKSWCMHKFGKCEMSAGLTVHVTAVRASVILPLEKLTGEGKFMLCESDTKSFSLQIYGKLSQNIQHFAAHC